MLILGRKNQISRNKPQSQYLKRYGSLKFFALHMSPKMKISMYNIGKKTAYLSREKNRHFFQVEIECKKWKIEKVDFSSKKWKLVKMLHFLGLFFTKNLLIFLNLGQKRKNLRKLEKRLFFLFPHKARGGGLLWSTL